MESITKIEPKIPKLPKRKRVDAYARISMESDRMRHSLSAQISRYSAYIRSNPEWEYAGVYADDGIRLTHRWSRNSKKESWTDECRKRASEYRREHAIKRDDITCFTTKIKCGHCGCNFRKQVSTMADGTKRSYWRCAERNGCVGKGLRDDYLRDMAAEVLGLDGFDEKVFLERISRVTVRDGTHLTFYFADGGTAERDYDFKRDVKPWTEERRQKYMATRKAHPMSDEQRKAASERMKKIRKERGSAWSKEK